MPWGPCARSRPSISSSAWVTARWPGCALSVYPSSGQPITAQVASIAACFPEQLLWIGCGVPPEASSRRAAASLYGSCGPQPSALSLTRALRQEPANRRQMLVLALVGGAGDGDLRLGDPQLVRREPHERQRLQRFDAAAERGQRVRVAGRRRSPHR